MYVKASLYLKVTIVSNKLTIKVENYNEKKNINGYQVCVKFQQPKKNTLKIGLG